MIWEEGKKFAEFVAGSVEDIYAVVKEYETYEVCIDEVERTVDLFSSLDENREYFGTEVNKVCAFLPRNQPLYALACFGLVPALMSRKVVVRPPTVMNGFFEELVRVLRLNVFFPNVRVTFEERRTFVTSMQDADAVIFTGTKENADKLRRCFNECVLFIANGSGHNPVVISNGAHLGKAAEGVVKVQFYNSGQDCAAPNAILVKSELLEGFLQELRFQLSWVKIGNYCAREVQIGPLSDVASVLKAQEVFVKNAPWLDEEFEGVIHTRSRLVHPTLIIKPLSEGGNFTESFAPVIFVQEYKEDSELKLYFEDTEYAKYAMYVTVYGESAYVDNLVHSGLHAESTIIRNTHLHAAGVERGTKEYGGCGYGASSFSIDGEIHPGPTLPQREIYEQLILGERREKTAIVELASVITMTEAVQAIVEQLRVYCETHIEVDDTVYSIFSVEQGLKREAFRTVYRLLIGKDNGPKLTSVMKELSLTRVIELLTING